jgi:outer membrane protein assembly factor BamB
MLERRDPALDRSINRYWDEVFGGDPAGSAPEPLDPDLAATVRRVHELDTAPPANPVFASRLWEELMHGQGIAGQVSLRPALPLRGATSPPRTPLRSWVRGGSDSRQHMVFAQIATALLIVVTLAAIYFAFFHGDQPAHQPATPPPPTAIPAPTVAPAAGDWPMFLGDAARSNVASAGPVARPGEHWRVQAGGPCDSAPLVVGGVVYAACGDGVLYALDAATGAERWRFTVADPLLRLAAASGLVYVGGGDTLYAVDIATHQERWRAALAVITRPVIDDGLLVAGTTDGYLVGVDAVTGQERWRYQVASTGIIFHPALADGIVYAGSDGGGLVAVDTATGMLRWRAEIGRVEAATARLADGVVYFSVNTDDGIRLRAFDAETGDVLWTSDTEMGSPTVSGGLGFAGGDGILYAIDIAAAAVRWQFPIANPIRDVYVAGELGYVFSEGDRLLYAFETATGRERWRYGLADSVRGGFSISGGVIYLNTAFGGIIALGETGGTPTPDGAGTVAASPTSIPATPSSPVTSAASPEAAATPTP